MSNIIYPVIRCRISTIVLKSQTWVVACHLNSTRTCHHTTCCQNSPCHFQFLSRRRRPDADIAVLQDSESRRAGGRKSSRESGSGGGGSHSKPSCSGNVAVSGFRHAGAKTASKVSVMSHDIVADEVMGAFHFYVVDLFFGESLNFDDLVPNKLFFFVNKRNA